MVDMCKAHSIAHTLLQFREDQSLDLAAIDEALRKHPEHSHVAVVHSETTSGIINNVQEIGEVVQSQLRLLISLLLVDSLCIATVEVLSLTR